jgi:hypothetical protein
MTGASNSAHAKGKFHTTMQLAQETSVPKVDVVRSNIVSPRAEAPSQGIDMVMAQQLGAPKKDVEKGVGTGGGSNAQNFF